MVDCKTCKNATILYIILANRLYSESGYVLCSQKHKKASVRVLKDYQPSCNNFKTMQANV